MFGFGKKKPGPRPCPANPGLGAEAKVAFSNGERSWGESVNLVSLAADALRQGGHAIVNEKTWLLHPDSGFLLTPQIVEVHPLDDGGVRTVTTMQVNHPTLAPDGLFEFQHSAGDSTQDAIAKGFDQWAQTDLVTLLDTLRPQPAACMALVMSFPAAAGKPERVRRAVLGPVSHFMQQPPPSQGEEEHPFCACCLLTKSFEAFKELIQGEGLYGLRLFAARDAEGETAADCRVNGEDWQPGVAALRTYAATWAAAGYEFRKQYVVLQTINKDADA